MSTLPAYSAPARPGQEVFGSAARLTNPVEVATEEGAAGSDGSTVQVVVRRIHLPLVLRQAK